MLLGPRRPHMRRRGGVWSPAAKASLVGWYSAGPLWCFTDVVDGTPCGDGSPVAVIKDRSGHGRHWTQPEPGLQPRLSLSGGQWVVETDGVAEELAGGDLSAAFTAGLTVGWRAYGLGTPWAALSDKPGHWDRFNDGNGYLNVGKGTRLDGRPGAAEGSWVTSVTRSSASGYSRRLDGVEDVTAAADFVPGATWMTGNGASSGIRLTGWVLFDEHLSDADAVRLETYLAGTP